jgi:hypothetical protein
MVKKQTENPLSNIFAKTEKPGAEEATPDPVRARGVGLKTSEWKRWDAIARELGLKPHALALYALRSFIKSYEAGEIKTETKKSLPGL